mgnify:CR=1 FL=1
MKNKNKAVWGTRFTKSTSKIFEQIGTSIDTDKRLFEEDILGSIIHTQMLVKQKIIKNKKGKKIINGLKKIRNEIRKNRFSFNKKYAAIIPKGTSAITINTAAEASIIFNPE